MSNFTNLTYNIKNMIKLTQSEIALLKNLSRRLNAPKKIKKLNSPRLVKKIKLQNLNWPHEKEWVVELYSNKDVITRWGKIGCELQSKKFRRAGSQFLYKKLWEKIDKGYEQV